MKLLGIIAFNVHDQHAGNTAATIITWYSRGRVALNTADNIPSGRYSRRRRIPFIRRTCNCLPP